MDVVAICDSDIIGKTFEEGKKQLDIKENFYKGFEVDEKKAIDLMQKLDIENSTFNIVGKKSVEAAVKAGIIVKENISNIKGIPFALKLI